MAGTEQWSSPRALQSPAPVLPPPPPPPVLPLLSFPNELLIMITSFLPVRDIASLARTSRWTCDLLTPTLYSVGCHQRTAENETPLHWAAAHNMPSVARRLLSRGADISAITCPAEETPLHIASRYGNVQVARTLLSTGAPISSGDIEGRTPLHAAVYPQNTETASLLLSYGACQVRDSNGELPIHHAIRQAHMPMIQLLLSSDTIGGLVNATHYDMSLLNYTFFHFSRGPPAELVQLLLDYGADINAPLRGNAVSAMHYTAQRGDLKALRLLLSRGGNPNIKMANGTTPLHDAASAADDPIIRMLVAAGAEIDARDTDGSTAMVYAVERGYEDIIRLLLSLGADVNAVDNHLMSPLARACAQCWFHVRPGVVEVLLGYGADPGMKDLDGASPLLYGAREGHKEIVAMLLGAGARVRDRDRHGDTALDLAEMLPNERGAEVVQMLREAMGMVRC